MSSHRSPSSGDLVSLADAAAKGTLAPRDVPLWLLCLALTLVVAVLLLAYGSRPVATWRVSHIVAPEAIKVGTVTPHPGLKLRSGRVETGPNAQLRLELGPYLTLRIPEKSRIDLPAAPGRFFARTERLEVLAGGLTGIVGGRSLEHGLVLVASDLEAELHGGSFLAFTHAESSAIGVLDGDLRVRISGAEESVALAPAQRIVLRRDKRRASLEPLSFRERVMLADMQGEAPSTLSD